MEQAPKRVALLHHTGGGNLGDDATMDVVIRNIRQRMPDAEITAFSMNPYDTGRKLGIPSYPIRRYTWDIGYKSARKEADETNKPGILNRFGNANNPLIRLPASTWHELLFLAASLQRLRSIDLLIVSGGGQLTERSGPWGFPYAIFIWVLMAKAAGVRCVFLNVGAGPLRHPLSRIFVRCALLAADYVSFRDEQSQALAMAIGFGGKSRVFPDNVYGFEVLAFKAAVGRRDRPIVGIAPMPYPFCDPREHPSDRQAIYENLIAKIARFASSLVQRSCSLELFGSDCGADPSAIEDLRTVLRNRHDIFTPEYIPVDSVRGLLSRMSTMDYVVTCRFHGVVFAHLLNKPVLAISHHPKVANLMNDLGLSEYCFDIEKFEPAQLNDAFESLVKDTEKIKRSMAASLASQRASLATQFDELFPPVPDEMRRLQSELAQVSGAADVSWWRH